MVANSPQPLGQRGVLGGDEAGVAGGIQVLQRVGGEAADVANGAGGPAAVA